MRDNDSDDCRHVGDGNEDAKLGLLLSLLRRDRRNQLGIRLGMLLGRIFSSFIFTSDEASETQSWEFYNAGFLQQSLPRRGCSLCHLDKVHSSYKQRFSAFLPRTVVLIEFLVEH